MHTTTVQDLLTCRNTGATALQLNLDEQVSYCDEIARSLATLTSLENLEIPLQPFYITEPSWEFVQVAELFHAIGDLENLQSFTLKARTLLGNAFPIGLLEPLLISAKHRLRYLHLDIQRLHCPSRAITRLANAVQQQTSLEWIKLKYSKLLINTSTDNGEIIDFRAIAPILQSLSQIPTLRHLQIVGAAEGEDNEFAFEVDDDIFPTMDPNTLVELAASPSLTDLRLEWVDLSSVAVITFSSALWQNACLQKLVLGLFPESETAYRAFAKMVRHNNSLEIIHLHTSWKTTSELSSLFAFATVTSTKSTQQFLGSFAEALPSNSSLREFHLCGPTIEEIPPAAGKSLIQALKSNHALTSLRIGSRNSDEGELCAAIQYYLKLNQLNRKHFVENYEQVREQSWIEVLADAKEDLNSVFYFLHLNPFLCQVSKDSPPSRRRRSKQKKGYSQPNQSPLPPNAPGSAASGETNSVNNGLSPAITGSALTQAVATLINNVANTMDLELQYRDEKEQELECEIDRLRKEIALLKLQQQQHPLYPPGASTPMSPHPAAQRKIGIPEAVKTDS